MKKLFRLISIITVLSLIFIGCQTSDDLISPVLEKKPGPITWVLPLPVNSTAGAYTEVDLVAGQFTVVGKVTVEQINAEEIELYYYTTGGWEITETHVSIGAHPSNLPQTSTGNPIVGHFEHNAYHPDVTEVGPIILKIPNLPTPESYMLYIAAHAVVNNCNDAGYGTIAVLCPDLPDNSIRTIIGPLPNHDIGYYLQARFVNSLAAFDETFNGWCVDPYRGLGALSSYNVNFLCTYEESFDCGGTSIFDKPENMGAVNWVINNARVLYPAATVNDIQWAIWKLLFNEPITPLGAGLPFSTPDLSGALVTEALRHTDYKPDCDEKVAVIVYQNDYDWCNYPAWAIDNKYAMQPFIIEVPVECEIVECGEETAWAFNYPPDETSALFPGHVWFRYFGYEIWK